jgi:probable HAF family extracellular repeat protein
MKYIAPRWIARVWACVIVFALAAVAHAEKPKAWTLISLGGTYAATVNNHGDIGGHARVDMPPGSFPSFANHAVIWENGVMHDVGTGFGTPPGSGFSTVQAVNDRGTFVLSTPDGVTTLKHGTLTALGFQAGPNAINKRGDIVGSMTVSGGTSPFLYRDGVLQDLGSLGGNFGIATSINDKGMIVGHSSLATGFNLRPFIYKDGVMKGLDTFGGSIGSASHVNNRGVVVGAAQDSNGRFIAFMTDESGVLRPFLDLPGHQGAGAINDRGAIVGTVDGKGYLYEDGEVTMLEDPEWYFLAPTAINERGWIVGTGNRRGGSFTGEAFLLVPSN